MIFPMADPTDPFATAAEASIPRAGDRVADRYRVVREIGRGAMGVVFEVVHEKLDRTCALKVLLPHARSDESALRRFEREAKILAKLSSPNLVQVLDVDRTNTGLPYLVMELLEGETLEARLARAPVSEAEALAWTRDLCTGAEAAHAAQIVHRDLKPSNVILTKSGAKIVDFGVAAFVSGSMEGSTASVAGTPRTMSPEQLLGERTGPASDVFAIGVVAYRMLAGRYPFEAESMAAQMLAIMKGHVPLDGVSKVSKAISDVISDALKQDPDLRISSARELASRLEAAQSGVESNGSAADELREPNPIPPGAFSETRPASRALAPRSASDTARAAPGFGKIVGAVSVAAFVVGGAWAASTRPWSAPMPEPRRTPDSTNAASTSLAAPPSASTVFPTAPPTPSVSAKPMPDPRAPAAPKATGKSSASVGAAASIATPAPRGDGFPPHL